nr:immunoglobulin light chain junction region [Macaca mulatta]MOX07415.1 immunoglobulin light chain junction region [Macaca mulatta]MOX07431.1 immunoglobulin light chain junction region [Macaca mulatta]MOX07495.1 immunoglobulin light chain junction region [Macaca mulatta]MOX08040.1 immunoglobulin light chain junction region [Macaca mulatta]
CMQALDYPLTF